MNRLLFTQTGEQLRNEIKAQSIVNQKIVTKQQQPKLPSVGRQTTLFVDTERDNLLYQQTLSELALSNLSKVASLSLLGPKSKPRLETHIRQELNLPSQHSYLDRNLEKQINHIISDKDLQTRKKRQLMSELKRLHKKRTTSNNNDETSQFSSCIEEHEKQQKMTAIVHAEGKLAQLTRRYKQNQLNDQKFRFQLNLSLNKLQDQKNMLIDAINPLSPIQMRENSQRQFDLMFHDNSEERFQNRMQEKHTKQVQQIWEQHQFPKQTKRWTQFIENARTHKK